MNGILRSFKTEETGGPPCPKRGRAEAVVQDAVGAVARREIETSERRFGADTTQGQARREDVALARRPVDPPARARPRDRVRDVLAALQARVGPHVRARTPDEVERLHVRQRIGRAGQAEARGAIVARGAVRRRAPPRPPVRPGEPTLDVVEASEADLITTIQRAEPSASGLGRGSSPVRARRSCAAGRGRGACRAEVRIRRPSRASRTRRGAPISATVGFQ